MATYKSGQYVDVPASDTVVYTATAKCIITSLIICNKAGAARTCDVKITRSGTTPTVQILNDAPIPLAGSLEVVQNRTIVLENTDELKVAASATSSLDVCVSVVEP